MKKTTIAALLLLTGSVAPGMAQTYTTFSAPDGSRSTTAKTLSGSLVTKGEYIDSSGVNHCFIRNAQGGFIEFEAPNSRGSFVGLAGAPSPEAGGGDALSAQLLVAGSFFDAAFVDHGYIRSPNGAITIIDYPGAVNTWVSSVDSSGGVVGYYADSTHSNHGFTRTAGGSYSAFSVPGGTFGTYVFGRSTNGTIIGTYWPNSGHGYAKVGTNYVFFDPVGSFNTFPADINNSDVITGDWQDANGHTHGFVVSVSNPSGIVSFDVSGASYTSARAINGAGVITGEYDLGSIPHGFIRAANGTITTFDVPGAIETVPEAINATGVVAGGWADATTWHGFIRQ